MPETLTELLRRQRREFEAAGVESPALSAELLLAEALGLERSALLHKLILEPDTAISDLEPDATSAVEKLQALCARRLQGEPVAYILGRKEFYGREFLVNRHTLIPRPETELIIDYALDWARQRTQSKKRDAYAPAAEHKFKATPLTPDKKIDLGHFADLGTGSGCLAVTLALELPGWPGLAMDISEPALNLARENARRLGVAIEQDTPEQRDTLNALNETGTIKKSDAPALSAVSGSLTFLAADFTRFGFAPGSLDLLVSNPPYVSEDEYARLDKGVRDFEPHSALVPTLSALPASLHPSQTDTMRQITQVTPVNEFQENAPPGTQLLAPLCALAAQALKPGGLFLMEIGCAQGDYVRSLLAQSPAWSKAVVLPDLAGLNRLVRAMHV